MASFTRSVMIDAPVEKVFDYMDDPNNLPGLFPSMVEVSEIGKLPNGGVCYKYVYKVAGIRMESYSEDIEHVQNVRTVSRSSGGIDYLATVTFEPAGLGTKVTVVNEYKVPVPLIGKLAEAVIVKMTEQEGEAVLANLKMKMEV